MSRPATRPLPFVPAAAALVVIAVLLAMVSLGQEDGVTSATGPAGAGAAELGEGFEAIQADELFATVAAAQREAGSWEVSSVAQMAEGDLPTATQQIDLLGDQVRFRVLMEVRGRAVEGRWVDEAFYLKDLNPKRWVPWYQMPDDENTRGYLASLVEASDANSLARLGEPATYEVLGIEDVTELDDDVVRTAHYRVGIDPSGMAGAQAADPATAPSLTIDMWVDAEDRPVQVRTTLVSAGEEFTTTLFFSDYGADFDITAPAADEVTDEVPPLMKA